MGGIEGRVCVRIRIYDKAETQAECRRQGSHCGRIEETVGGQEGCGEEGPREDGGEKGGEGSWSDWNGYGSVDRAGHRI